MIYWFLKIYHSTPYLGQEKPMSHSDSNEENKSYVPVISATGKWRQEDQKYKVILGYTASSKPVWATGDPAQSNTTNNNNKK